MSGLGQDVPLGRPDADGRAALFVPVAGIKEELLTSIRAGAAIVGYANHDGSFTIYFESNRFDDPALAKWEHKARKAYDRLVDNAPTTSKMNANADHFEQIGYINGKGLTIRRMESLKRWLADSNAIDSCPEMEIVPRSVLPKPEGRQA